MKKIARIVLATWVVVFVIMMFIVLFMLATGKAHEPVPEWYQVTWDWTLRCALLVPAVYIVAERKEVWNWIVKFIRHGEI